MTVIELIDKAIYAAIQAGIQISKVYSTADFDVQQKDDNTPVTLADTKAHDTILKALESTRLPVLSEEGAQISFAERKKWNLFWMVDPLDGTKEFIKRNDEFTVNIALISRNEPVAGVIYAPVTGEIYAGISELGSWKLLNPAENCTFQSMQQSGEKLPLKKNMAEYIIAVSQSHMNAETENYIEDIRKKHELTRLINKGSSLKICMVAEGSANIYPKLGKTMEWDTAAGHAILKASGKNIFRQDLKTELIYNKENLQNPNFIVL